MSRLREDLGFQRLFTNQWLDTYDLLKIDGHIRGCHGQKFEDNRAFFICR